MENLGRPCMFLSVVLLSCCATTIPQLDRNNSSEFRKHVLMFNTRGGMLDPTSGRQELSRVSSRTHYNELPVGTADYEAYVRDVIEEIRRQKIKNGRARLLFFFHGGLNSRAAALKRAAHDIAAMNADDEKLYPIFVNWQTSAYGSYIDHLFWIKNGQDVGSKGPFLAPFQITNDLIRSAGDIPVANVLQFSDFWRSLTPHPDEKVVIAQGCKNHLNFRQGMSPEQTVGSRVKRALTGLPTTILTKWWIAGILSAAGRSAWSSMIYTSDRLFYSDSEMHRTRGDGYSYANPSVNGAGGLSGFLERLITSGVLDKEDDITLVAHSAGAIVANTIVGNFGNDLPIHTLVYMAPACTIDELMPGGRISAFLSDRGHDPRGERKLYILALHEQADLNESWYADLTPRGSLLVWLDEFIQPKNSELRGVMMGRVRNLRTHAHLISCDLYDRIQITAYNEDSHADPKVQPQRHGQFGDLRYWSPDVWNPILPRLKTLATTTVPHDVEARRLP